MIILNAINEFQNNLMAKKANFFESILTGNESDCFRLIEVKVVRLIPSVTNNYQNPTKRS